MNILKGLSFIEKNNDKVIKIWVTCDNYIFVGTSWEDRFAVVECGEVERENLREIDFIIEMFCKVHKINYEFICE